jgi:hypothetical protein
MRIRSIKPEFWRSDDVTKLPWDDRLLFIGLWSYVDDNGVGLDKLAAVTADLFAGDLERDSSETFARVSRGLQNLFEAGRIIRYTIEGKAYLEIVNWEKHQRIDKPNKERYPRHDAENTVIQDQFATPSRQSRETLAPVTGEQGNRGTGEQRKEKTCPVGPDEFIDWYLEYPRKEARAAAERAYTKARKTATAEQLVAGAIRYAQDPNREAQYTKLPATWLNSGCWEDGPLPARGQQQKPTGSQLRLQAGYELLQQTRTETNTQHQIGA